MAKLKNKIAFFTVFLVISGGVIFSYSKLNVGANTKNITASTVNDTSNIKKESNTIASNTTTDKPQSPVDSAKPNQNTVKTQSTLKAASTGAATSSQTTSNTPAPSSTSTSSNTSSGNTSAPKYDLEYMEQVESAIITLCNQERVTAGKNALASNETLRKIARYKSNQMLQYSYFAHNSPVDGFTPMQLAKSFEWSSSTFGENIWMISTSGYSYSSFKAIVTASKIVNDWMNSTGHRENILNSNYTKIGVGVVCSSCGKAYATQEFSN